MFQDGSWQRSKHGGQEYSAADRGSEKGKFSLKLHHLDKSQQLSNTFRLVAGLASL